MISVLLALAGLWVLTFAAGEKKVVVLELANKAGITDDEVYALTDQARIAASKFLPRGKFIVMTSESIQDLLLPDMDLKKCTAVKCEVEMGRMLGADYIITERRRNKRQQNKCQNCMSTTRSIYGYSFYARVAARITSRW